MPPIPRPVSSDAIANAILHSATDGFSSDSEAVADAELSMNHLRTILGTLQRAEEEVKEEIRQVSCKNAAQVDSWMSQSRRVQTDIEESKLQANKILELAEEEKALKQTLVDAETKHRFLAAEIKFNESLATVLGSLQLIGATLGQVDGDIGSGQLDIAVGTLNGAEEALARLRGIDEIIVVGLMKERAKQLREILVRRVEGAWFTLVDFDAKEGRVTIRKKLEVSGVEMSSDTVISALEYLNLMKPKIDQFHQHIDKTLVLPRLDTRVGRIPSLQIDGDTLWIVGYGSDLSAANMFRDLQLIIEFLNAHLPVAVMSHLQRILIPNLTNRLISTRLASSVPPTLGDLPVFEELLQETKKFEDILAQNGLTGERQLSDWVERAPKVWLFKRRETSLDRTRELLSRGIGKVEVVERSETQMVLTEDGKGALEADVAAVSGVDGMDWNNDNWSEDEGEEQVPKSLDKTKDPKLVDHDADDWGDWGGDDDDDEVLKKSDLAPKSTPAEAHLETGKEHGKEKDEDEDDWGDWGDDDGQPPPQQVPIKPASATKSTASKRRNSQSITLTETYTITSIPSSLLELINIILQEADTIASSPPSSITSASPDMMSLPCLILAIFRALAPQSYSTDICSNMYLYNDCLYLSEHLPQDVSDKDRQKILNFGKRHYSKEIDAQRTLLLDYLDQAQGFVACTEYPQSTECETAVSSTIDRIYELHSAWGSVLSKSVLYQSLGSLLHTILVKLINDVEDLSDISAPESEKLRTLFAEIVEGIEGKRVFGKEGGAALYCQSWWKFKYLEQILEGSMAHITYLWREGNLGEFEREEVMDLIRALFADNENRRRCLDEVGHSSGR